MIIQGLKANAVIRRLAIMTVLAATFAIGGCGGKTGIIPGAMLAVSNSTLSFGDVLVGTATAQLVSLMNTGSASFRISSVSVSGNGYSVSGASKITLAPNQSVTVAVNFGPTATGTAAGMLTVSSDAANPVVQVTIDGAGVTTLPGTHSVQVSWTPSASQVIGYFVYRSSVSGGPYLKLNITADPNPSYTDTNLASGAYYYVVTSVDANGIESGYSKEVQVLIL